MPDGVHQPRQYSLTRADDGEHRHFSVKRVTAPGKPDGEVSTLLHDLDVGDRLTMSLPFGDVVLDDRPPGRVRSAGIGITPMAGHALPPRRRQAPGSRSRCCTPTSTRARSPCAARS